MSVTKRTWTALIVLPLLSGSGLAQAEGAYWDWNGMMDYPYMMEPGMMWGHWEHDRDRHRADIPSGYVVVPADHWYRKGLSYGDRKDIFLGTMNLSDSQKQSFTKYEEALKAMQPNNAKQPLTKVASVDQRIQSRIDQLKNRIVVLEAVQKARADFVKTLSPEQIKLLNAFETKGEVGSAVSE